MMQIWIDTKMGWMYQPNDVFEEICVTWSESKHGLLSHKREIVKECGFIGPHFFCGTCFPQFMVHWWTNFPAVHQKPHRKLSIREPRRWNWSPKDYCLKAWSAGRLRRLIAKEVGWDLCSWNGWEDSADLLVMMVISYLCLWYLWYTYIYIYIIYIYIYTYNSQALP